MKKSLFPLVSLALCCVLTACGGQDTGTSASQAPTVPQTTQPSVSTQPQETPDASASADVPVLSAPVDENAGESHILIAYFTYGENPLLADGVDASTSASIQYRGDALTGNTGLVADMIADATGGELFSILSAELYPDNYDDTINVGQSEKNASVRPELTTQIENLDRYDTIFLGFPNWWGDMPMAVYSFLDEYDFSGKTIIPFVTSGGSGFSNTIHAIENAEPDATVLEGLSLRNNRSTQAESDVAEWLSRLGLAG